MGDKNGPPVWDLSPLVESEDPKDVKKAMDECLRDAEKFEEKYKERIIGLTPSGINQLYSELDSIQMRRSHLFSYVFLRRKQDCANRIAEELFGYSMKLYNEFMSKLAFFDIEVARTLVDRPAIVSAPEVAEYRHALEKARERGRYLLSERDEQIMLQKDTYGIDSWWRFHTRLLETREYEISVDGEKKKMGAKQILDYASSRPEREIRKAAVEALYQAISLDRLAHSTALESMFGNHLTQVRLRKYPSVVTPSLMLNDISQTVLDTLIASLKAHIPTIRRYLRVRAEAMGLERLAGYDMSPRLIASIAETQSSIPWADAKRLVIEAYASFDRESGEFVSELFEKRRVNTLPDGFCVQFPSLRTSYVSAGYNGTVQSILTLAHECGHALHGYYRSEKHKWVNFSTSMCLAETASVFGEMLVADELLGETEEDHTRLAALDTVLTMLFKSIYYQLNAYLFELSVFRSMENNEAIDATKLDEMWMAARNEVFGDSIEWLPGMEQWWMIPVHYYKTFTRFYNYPYAFAQLVALVLYQRYKEGASFLPKIKRILSAGGSESPQTLLTEIGLDLTNPEFWDAGFELAESYLDQFEQIVNRASNS